MVCGWLQFAVKEKNLVGSMKGCVYGICDKHIAVQIYEQLTSVCQKLSK